MSFSVPGALFDGPHGQVLGAQGSGFRVQGSEFRSYPFPCNHLKGVGTTAEGRETHPEVQGQACTAKRGGRGAYSCGSVAFGRISTLLRRRTWLFEEDSGSPPPVRANANREEKGDQHLGIARHLGNGSVDHPHRARKRWCGEAGGPHLPRHIRSPIQHPSPQATL